MSSRRSDGSPEVRGGIGWPGTARRRARSRLGWPGTSRVRAAGAVATEDVPAPLVDGARVPSQVSPVSRETEAAPSVAVAGPTAEIASRENTEQRALVSRETPQSPAPRETGPAAEPAVSDRSSLVEGVPPDATPLATAVEYSLRLRDELRDKRPFVRPKRTRVMVVANQKGGVGKTTTTVNLAATLADHGLRVLVIDLDPQGNASTALGIDHHRGTPSSYDALVDGTPLNDLMQESSEAPGLFVVPATIDLAGAEIELVSVVARENRLRKAVHGCAQVFSTEDDRIDYVLIDCPPSLGLLTLNALVAADELLLPIQTEYYALEGVGQLLETVELVRADLNPGLWISTVLLTMYDARTRLSAGVADEVRAHFGDRVLRTAIPRSVRVSEAPSHGRTVMTYDPASPGALSYLEAAREMTDGGQAGQIAPPRDAGSGGAWVR